MQDLDAADFSKGSRMLKIDIHGTSPNNYGCVVVQSGLESLPGDLEGRTIEINTGGN